MFTYLFEGVGDQRSDLRGSGGRVLVKYPDPYYFLRSGGETKRQFLRYMVQFSVDSTSWKLVCR